MTTYSRACACADPDCITALRAENARLTARVKELEEALAARKGLHEGAVLALDARVKELEEFVLFVDKWTNYKPEKTEKPTSYEDCVKTIAPMAREFARAALEGKP